MELLGFEVFKLDIEVLGWRGVVFLFLFSFGVFIGIFRMGVVVVSFRFGWVGNVCEDGWLVLVGVFGGEINSLFLVVLGGLFFLEENVFFVV